MDQIENTESTEVVETTPVETTEAAPSLRETITEAMDAGGEADPSQTKEGRDRDAAGRFAAQNAGKVQDPSQIPAGAPAPKEAAGIGVARPPASWRPETREHWQKLPPQVQQEVLKREAEITRGLQETTSQRQAVEAFKELMSPFMPIAMGRYGGDVTGMIRQHAQTEMQLLNGTQADVAKAITNAIQEYGVGRFGKGFIETLDGALVGIEPQITPQEAIQRAVQQQMAPLQQAWQQATQNSQAQQAQAAAHEVSGFAQNAEFYDQVRNRMADMIETAAARGQGVTLEQAYVEACWSDPNVRGKLIERQGQMQAQQRTQAAQRARSAAVSVNGAPVPRPAMSTEGMDRRSAVSAAFDALSDRV